MTQKPVTRERVLRRVRKYRHLFTLPKLHIHAAHLDRAWGLAMVADKDVIVLIDDKDPRCDEVLDRIILHELAHAENYHVRGSLRHDADWRAICCRVSEDTGLHVT